MKHIETTPRPCFCTCNGSSLLLAGEVCEICMGVVTEPQAPESSLFAAEAYDEQYFEALENWYDSMETAA